MQKFIEGTVRGYKATDANMQCRGFQFEIGKWFECPDGDIIMCGANGFHFCEYPSGPHCYYTAKDTRVFHVESEQVIKEPSTPGADRKLVCRRIRLLSEIISDGDLNTGYLNTGDRNTGDGNTGYRNTGYGNTGDGNTGYRNTGYGNATNWCSGFFCEEEPKAVSFGVATELTVGEILEKFFSEIYSLSIRLHETEEICFDDYSAIPNITPEKLKSLHVAHLKAKAVVANISDGSIPSTST